MKILIFVALIIGAFILIYKNLNKIKAIIRVVKIKVMSVFLSIKNFFSRIFKK